MTDSEKSTPDTRHRAIDRHPDDQVRTGRPPLGPEDVEGDRAPEDLEGEVGAEGGSGGSHRAGLPFLPAEDDDSPLGSTDQHSKA